MSEKDAHWLADRIRGKCYHVGDGIWWVEDCDGRLWGEC